MADEIHRALGILNSVDWILRVHRKAPEGNFDDEELAGVIDLLAANLNEALLPYPQAPNEPADAAQPGSAIHQGRTE